MNPIVVDLTEIEQVRLLYMQSEHVEWAAFCSEKGWHPISTRNKYPVTQWVAEKRRVVAEVHAQEIRESVLTHRIAYRKDVLRTLREYPATSDAIHNLIRIKVNKIIKELAKNPEATRTVVAKGRAFEVPLLDSEELVKLALAMKTITESKHRSLLLSDVVAKVAADAPAALPDDADNTEVAKADGSWTIDIVGMGKVAPDDLNRMQIQYLDKPQNKPEDPLEQLATPLPEFPAISDELRKLDGES